MAVVAGIDEAGFGPILGPLVVSAAVFEVPDAVCGQSLWDLLAPAVRKRPHKHHSGLCIGDSKKLYTPATGLTQLERGVLGTMSLLRADLSSLRAMLQVLCPQALEKTSVHPWYQDDLSLPLSCEPVDMRLRANGLRAAMANCGVALAAARSEVLLEAQYNQLVTATNNKAVTLLDHTCRLLYWVAQAHRSQPLTRIFIDRQGGREHYLPALQRTFEGGQFKIIVEHAQHSGYRITTGPAVVEVHFMEGGEDRHLAVALASMISKYLRELFMQLFNRYWAAQVPGLKPTAGYYTDGKRFLRDIEDARRRLNTPDGILIRCR